MKGRFVMVVVDGLFYFKYICSVKNELFLKLTLYQNDILCRIVPSYGCGPGDDSPTRATHMFSCCFRRTRRRRRLLYIYYIYIYIGCLVVSWITDPTHVRTGIGQWTPNIIW